MLLLFDKLLNLNSIPQLQAQIESACIDYETNPTKEKREDICNAIDKLEAFYLDNEQDKRCVLIEMLCVQLRQVLVNTEFEKKEEMMEQEDDDDDEQEKEEKTFNTVTIKTKDNKIIRPIYPWEYKKKMDDDETKYIEEYSSSQTSGKLQLSDKTKINEDEEEPAFKADRIASLTYQAAHNSKDDNILSPFAKQVNFCNKEKEIDECTIDSSSSKNKNDDEQEKQKIVAQFTIKLSEKDYYEILRRKQVYQASLKGAKTNNNNKKQSVEYYRREEKYCDEKINPLVRQEQSANWVANRNFVI